MLPTSNMIGDLCLRFNEGTDDKTACGNCTSFERQGWGSLCSCSPKSTPAHIRFCPVSKCDALYLKLLLLRLSYNTSVIPPFLVTFQKSVHHKIDWYTISKPFYSQVFPRGNARGHGRRYCFHYHCIQFRKKPNTQRMITHAFLHLTQQPNIRHCVPQTMLSPFPHSPFPYFPI